jgi:hypothetical protein
LLHILPRKRFRDLACDPFLLTPVGGIEDRDTGRRIEFNSYPYVFVFLPITWILYTLFRTRQFNKLVLMVASCIFYAWKTPWYIVPLFLSGILDYVVCRRMTQVFG